MIQIPSTPSMAKCSMFLVVFGLTVCLHEVLTANPGVKVKVTSKGINYANTIAQAALREEVRTLKIDDQYGKNGRVEYWFRNVRINSVSPPSSSMTLDAANNGIAWRVSNLGISISGDWRVKYRRGWFKISTSGGATASVSGTSISVSVRLGKDSSGRPSVSMAACSTSVSRVDVRFNGGIASWLLNRFDSRIERKLKDVIQGKMCDIVRKQVNTNANAFLGRSKVMVDLADVFALDYRLVSTPQASSSSLETHHKGTVYWAARRQEPPTSPRPIPASGDSSKMVYIWLSDYTLNTLTYAAHSNNFLSRTLTAQDLPPGYRDLLSTSCTSGLCVGAIIPAIQSACSDCDVINVELSSLQPPDVQISPSQAAVTVVGKLELLGLKPDSSRVSLLTLRVSVRLTLDANIVNDVITGRVLDNSGVSFNIIDSRIGSIDLSGFNAILDIGVKEFVIPNVNELGARGFPLPMPGDVTLVSPSLQFVEGAMMVSTDVRAAEAAPSRPRTPRPFPPGPPRPCKTCQIP